MHASVPFGQARKCQHIRHEYHTILKLTRRQRSTVHYSQVCIITEILRYEQHGLSLKQGSH